VVHFDATTLEKVLFVATLVMRRGILGDLV
jgi:hypothetical protein